MTRYFSDSTKSVKLISGVNKGLNYTPPLLSSIWSDHTIDDQSWLRADTFSWQSGSVYSNAYTHLTADISGKTAETETIGSYTVTFYRATDGHKICLADQETIVSNIFSATGIAWYYILDTTNTRFKLPRTKWSFEGVRDNVGDYITESLPNITGKFGLARFSSTSTTDGAFNTTTSLYNVAATSGSGLGGNTTTLDASRSSSTYQDNAPVQERATQMYLYFYVGEFTQTALQQTAGLNSSLFNGKIDIDLGNVTSTTKETMVGWGMPDYSAGIDLSIGSSEKVYTCPKDGVIDTFLIGFNGGTSYLKINDEVILQVTTPSTTYLHSASGQFKVKKNDVVKVVESYTNQTAYGYYYAKFYPLKGVN